MEVVQWLESVLGKNYAVVILMYFIFIFIEIQSVIAIIKKAHPNMIFIGVIFYILGSVNWLLHGNLTVGCFMVMLLVVIGIQLVLLKVRSIK